jgi:dynein heavy chain
LNTDADRAGATTSDAPAAEHSRIPTNLAETATGMLKLQDTEKRVAELQEEWTAMQPMLKQTVCISCTGGLKQTVEETAAVMIQISKSKVVAEETAIVVGEQEATATAEAAATKAIADDAQRDLDEALPALDHAVASLKSLKKGDITELKQFSDPSGGVKMVMEVVVVMEAACIMLSVKPKMEQDPDNPGKKIANYWAVTGSLLVSPAKFLESLFQYDKENIPASVISKIQPYVPLGVFSNECRFWCLKMLH